MHSEVSVTLSPQQEYRIDLEGKPPMANDEGRRWLEEQFTRLECEPLRASGKVLTADKVLTVASAAGAPLLSDPVWSVEFARATSAALGKAVVRVDVSAMAISY